MPICVERSRRFTATAESASEMSLSRVCRAGLDFDKRLHTIIVVGEREGIEAPCNTAEFAKAYNDRDSGSENPHATVGLEGNASREVRDAWR